MLLNRKVNGKFDTISSTMRQINHPLQIQDAMRDFECAFRNSLYKYMLVQGNVNHACTFHFFQANVKQISCL